MSWRVEQARDLWQRALDSLAVAGRDLSEGYCDLAASRAYYAAFHAASALLLVDEKRFAKHSGVIASVHRDYVKEGKLPTDAGKILSSLFYLRNIADYGGTNHVAPADAQRAVADAQRFLDLVRPLLPLE